MQGFNCQSFINFTVPSIMHTKKPKLFAVHNTQDIKVDVLKQKIKLIQYCQVTIYHVVFKRTLKTAITLSKIRVQMFNIWLYLLPPTPIKSLNFCPMANFKFSPQDIMNIIPMHDIISHN